MCADSNDLGLVSRPPCFGHERERESLSLPFLMAAARPREEGNKICNRGENVMKFASMKRWKLARNGRTLFEQVVRDSGWLLHLM